MGARERVDGEVTGRSVLAPDGGAGYFLGMSTIAEVERLALDLPEGDRALLAAHLLQSLPPVLDDEDEGIAEALRRAADFKSNPNIGMSLEQLDERIKSRREGR